MTHDKTQAALDALERLLSYTNGLGDGAAYTIRAALTAQDVNAEKYDALFGTIESQKQTHDALIRMNRELLEALKLTEWSNGGFCPICGGSIHGSIGGQIIKTHKDYCEIGNAIARAEKKSGS